MIIKMFKCDNPACRATEHPEDGGTEKKPITPYGWIHLEGFCQGVGPRYDFTVCSVACVEHALDAADDENVR